MNLYCRANDNYWIFFKGVSLIKLTISDEISSCWSILVKHSWIIHFYFITFSFPKSSFNEIQVNAIDIKNFAILKNIFSKLLGYTHDNLADE